MIGVYIRKAHAQNLITMNPEFVNSHRYIRYIELAKANQDIGVILYFFTNKGVSFEKKCVKGIYYNNQENIWQEKKFPLPDLLYDRGGGTTRESKLVINEFRKLGIKNINAQHYFDKWNLYDRLSKLDTVSSHVPATLQGDTTKNIFKMLNQYRHVYVKTRRGSCGKGVIRIEKLGPNQFRYYYSIGGKLLSEIFTEPDLMKIIYRFFGDNPFIVQKPIDLIKSGQCIIDFRSEVQKNGNGQIIVIGTTARIGKPRSPIASNTHKEDYYPLEKFMKGTMQLNAQKADVLQGKINDFLLTVYRAVEQAYGSFGEIGIDFGLDMQGHLWLIECNSKSAKVALYNAFGPKKVRQSFHTLLQYAKYLLNKQNNYISYKEGE